MDRSVDSIGSCSLDVDADSSDVTDTSGSLNFPTPISIKDIPKEFTTNIRERCSVRTLNPTSGVSIAGESGMVLNQPKSSMADSSALLTVAKTTKFGNASVTSPEKKPSYLNLACCVNGYSNLTTYDSKVRQDINKSREVSPIRPSSNSIQYCKKNNSLAPPLLHAVRSEEKSCNLYDNNGKVYSENNASMVQEDYRNTSFIQQRVERLYGPAALAQGFYSPKKVRSGSAAQIAVCERNVNDTKTSELTKKFQQLTPSKDYSEFRKKLNATTANSTRQVVSSSDIGNADSQSVDLPVLRHLSQEFRAQLPIISPKRNLSANSPNRDNGCTVQTTPSIVSASKPVSDVVDHQIISNSSQQLLNDNLVNGSTKEKHVQYTDTCSINQKQVEKDGHYFLTLLKSEQARLLMLASEAEKYIDLLTNDGDASEDTLGLLRSASGKARLLVSQKMKQFEGLCHKNINCSPEDKFPTTLDDLQGFWDMVYLQVDHINSIFSEIEVLKLNNWKKPNNAEQISEVAKPLSKPNKTVIKKTKTCVSNGSGPKAPASAISAAAAKREAQRKMLQEMKRKNRIAMTSKSITSDQNASEPNTKNINAVEIFVSDSSSALSQ